MTSDGPPSGSSRALRWAGAVGLLVALVAGAYVLFERFVRDPAVEPAVTVTPPNPPDRVPDAAITAAQPPDAGEADLAANQARIRAVKGDVQRSDATGGSMPRWTQVREGELLSENERLRTAHGATAELSVGNASSIVVNESTEVGVTELSEAVQRFKLVRGRVTAEAAQNGKRTLRIESEDGQSASSNGGRFSVLAVGKSFTVATERGTVNLASAGAVVTVEQGQQASANAGAKPAPPAPIPVDVLLLAARGAKGCQEINGTAPLGSEVVVGDARAVVDAKGRFSVKLQNVKGRTSVTVRTRDAAGHVQERVVNCPSAAKSGEVDGIAIKRWHKHPK